MWSPSNMQKALNASLGKKPKKSLRPLGKFSNRNMQKAIAASLVGKNPTSKNSLSKKSKSKALTKKSVSSTSTKNIEREILQNISFLKWCYNSCWMDTVFVSIYGIRRGIVFNTLSHHINEFLNDIKAFDDPPIRSCMMENLTRLGNFMENKEGARLTNNPRNSYSNNFGRMFNDYSTPASFMRGLIGPIFYNDLEIKYPFDNSNFSSRAERINNMKEQIHHKIISLQNNLFFLKDFDDMDNGQISPIMEYYLRNGIPVLDHQGNLVIFKYHSISALGGGHYRTLLNDNNNSLIVDVGTSQKNTVNPISFADFYRVATSPNEQLYIFVRANLINNQTVIEQINDEEKMMIRASPETVGYGVSHSNQIQINKIKKKEKNNFDKFESELTNIINGLSTSKNEKMKKELYKKFYYITTSNYLKSMTIGNFLENYVSKNPTLIGKIHKIQSNRNFNLYIPEFEDEKELYREKVRHHIKQVELAIKERNIKHGLQILNDIESDYDNYILLLNDAYYGEIEMLKMRISKGKKRQKHKRKKKMSDLDKLILVLKIRPPYKKKKIIEPILAAMKYINGSSFKKKYKNNKKSLNKEDIEKLKKILSFYEVQKKYLSNFMQNQSLLFNSFPNKIKNGFYSLLFSGGSNFIKVPGFGRRKVRYQKNGRAYVIVNKKKLKLN